MDTCVVNLSEALFVCLMVVVLIVSFWAALPAAVRGWVCGCRQLWGFHCWHALLETEIPVMLTPLCVCLCVSVCVCVCVFVAVLECDKV